MKGKIVLVDFWATWCGPCVAELPNVLDTYKKYHNKGFEVIGISLDEDEAALKSFIKKKKLPWPQYFDGLGWKNSIAKKYSIRSVPATFLIGKNGKVVGSNLRGSELGVAVARQLAGESASLTSIAYANSVKDIVDGIEKEKVTKFVAYLQANPKSDDRPDGLSHLITAYTNLGVTEKTESLLSEKYELLTNGKNVQDLNLIPLLHTTIEPILNALSTAGKIDDTRAFLAKVRKDTAGHEMFEIVEEFIDDFSAQLNGPDVGDVLEIAFTDLNGRKVDLAAMNGKVVLVDFWATWSGPYIAKLPKVLDAYKKYHDKGFEIIGISLDEDEVALKSFIKEKNLPWPQYFDGLGRNNSIAKKYSINLIPATYLIDQDGEIYARNVGEMLEPYLESLLIVK